MSEHYVTAMVATMPHNYVLMACRCGEIISAQPYLADGMFSTHVREAQVAA